MLLSSFHHPYDKSQETFIENAKKKQPTRNQLLAKEKHDHTMAITEQVLPTTAGGNAVLADKIPERKGGRARGEAAVPNATEAHEGFGADTSCDLLQVIGSYRSFRN